MTQNESRLMTTSTLSSTHSSNVLMVYSSHPLSDHILEEEAKGERESIIIF